MNRMHYYEYIDIEDEMIWQAYEQSEEAPIILDEYCWMHIPGGWTCIQCYREQQQNLQNDIENEKMKLREALQEAKSSVTPGAISEDGHSYVCMAEEDTDRPYWYYPDIDAKPKECWRLQEDQVDSVVLFASQDCWIPTSNFVF